MSVFKIHGGKKLKGTIIPQGAKNEALQIVSAMLLSAEPITINLPDIVTSTSSLSLLATWAAR